MPFVVTYVTSIRNTHIQRVRETETERRTEGDTDEDKHLLIEVAAKPLLLLLLSFTTQTQLDVITTNDATTKTKHPQTFRLSESRLHVFANNMQTII